MADTAKPRLINQMKLRIPSLSVNESTARSMVAAFIAQADPTLSEIADIKCVISEAVTNCIVHAYPDATGNIYITAGIYGDRSIRLEIKDRGVGIDDVKRARTPLFTTSPESERSGMGFTVMESFTDKMRVRSVSGKGTTVTLWKRLEALRLPDL